MKIKVWVVKDEEGVLRPMAGVWSAEGRMREANREEWDENLSKKKHFKNCTLVEATLEEVKADE